MVRAICAKAAMMTASARSGVAYDSTVTPVIFAVAIGHFLNDLMQALIPASYPLLRQNLDLSFTEIGLITFVFQAVASVLQPMIGFYTDKRPMPYAMALGMASTGVGLIALSYANSLAWVLCSVALVGLGSAVFHPEAARITRLAAGARPGFGQSLFQVGGNAGTAIGPLGAAWIIMSRGQTAVAWFAVAALLAMLVLWGVGRWFVRVGAARATARKARVITSEPLEPHLVRRGMALIVLLMGSKFIYTVSISSYYTFYLMEQFDLSARQSQICLFIFLAAVAAGTIIGGPIGDRVGRRRVILWSILGILPLTIALPWLPLVLTVPVSAVAGLMLASAFPSMVVYAQDLMPKYTGMVAGLLFGLAFGLSAFGAAGLGILADAQGIVRVYQICSFLPLLGVVAFFLPEPRR